MKKKIVIRTSIAGIAISATIAILIIGKQPIPTDLTEKTASVNYKIEDTGVDSVAIKKFNKLVAFIRENGVMIYNRNNIPCYGYEFRDKGSNFHFVVNQSKDEVEVINVLAFTNENFAYYDITKDGINTPTPEADQLYKNFVAEVTINHKNK